MHAREVLVSGFLSAALIGCTPPNVYSTIDEGSQIKDSYKKGNYDPVVVRADVKVKLGFFNLLKANLCPSSMSSEIQFEDMLPRKDKRQHAIEGVCEKKSTATDFGCWAAKDPLAKACVDAVALHAIDQCAILIGRQNQYATNFAEWILPLQAAFGLGADIAAISTASSSRTTALTAALLASSVDVQKGAPTVVSVKASDIATAEQSLVLMSGITDADVTKLQYEDPNRTKGENTAVPPSVKFSLLHDTLLSSCPAYSFPRTPWGAFRH